MALPASLSHVLSSGNSGSSSSLRLVASLAEAWDWVPRMDELSRCVFAWLGLAVRWFEKGMDRSMVFMLC